MAFPRTIIESDRREHALERGSRIAGVRAEIAADSRAAAECSAVLDMQVFTCI
jgi:hypothetical protein